MAANVCLLADVSSLEPSDILSIASAPLLGAIPREDIHALFFQPLPFRPLPLLIHQDPMIGSPVPCITTLVPGLNHRRIARLCTICMSGLLHSQVRRLARFLRIPPSPPSALLAQFALWIVRLPPYVASRTFVFGHSNWHTEGICTSTLSFLLTPTNYICHFQVPWRVCSASTQRRTFQGLRPWDNAPMDMQLYRVNSSRHLGAVRTLSMLARFYWWVGVMSVFCTKWWTRCCLQCQVRTKSPQTARWPILTVPLPSGPGVSVGVDCVAPLPTIPSGVRLNNPLFASGLI